MKSEQIQQKSLDVIELITGKKDVTSAMSMVVCLILETMDESQRMKIFSALQEIQDKYGPL